MFNNVLKLFFLFPFFLFGAYTERDSKIGFGQAENPIFESRSVSIPFFIPPDGWECVNPQKLTSPIQAAFFGKGQSDFRPSLNLATEKTDVTLKEYIKAVRKIHESEMNAQWRDLGPFTFSSGKGRLAEITTSSPLGVVKMLQGILVQDGCAYILTGAVLKDEFSSWQKDLLNTMHSLMVVPDLFSAIADLSQRSRLQEIFRSFDHLSSAEERQIQWSRLQKIILDDFASMGSHWHLLILKEGHKRIFSES